MNDIFQTQLREMEQESRATSSLARTSSTTGGSRIRASVPESLVNRLGPLAMETVVAAPTAPSSNVRERLGTAPPPRIQPRESRLGRSVVQNRNNSQTVSRRNDPPATANPAALEPIRPESLGTIQDGHVHEAEHEYPDVSGGRDENDWRRKSHGVAIVSDTRRGLAASRTGAVQLYDYAPTCRLERVASGQYLWTFEHTIFTDVRQRARELTPPARRGKFQAQNKPNNKHHKMYRQFAKPPGQTPGEYSRDYPRTTMVDGDEQRYGKLKAPIGDGLFAAYDPLEMKAAKYLIVASSDYLYTPRSLFWPDVIFLTAPKLDWGQAIGMMISVRRVVSMEPQVIVVAGSNDHLQSRGLLSRLTDGSIPSNEVIGEAIMTLLSAMAEVEAAARQRFTMNVVKVIFVLSPGYAALPEPLQFV